MAAHQAPPSLGFSRQEYWSGLPFPSPMHDSEKWKWSRSVVSDSSRPHGLQPTRLLRPWDFPGTTQSQTCTKKDHGHCLVICCPSDPLHLSESRQNHYIWEVILRKLMRCTENCSACSQCWSREMAKFFFKTVLGCLLYNQSFKSWMSWAMKFCLICYSHMTSRQLTNHFFKHLNKFCRENASISSRRQNMLSKSSLNPRAWIFILQE